MYSSNILGRFVALALVATSSLAFSPRLSNVNVNARAGSRTRIVLSATKELPEGIVKTVSKPGSGKAVSLGDIATIKYSCYLPSDDKSSPFAKADKQKMVVGDGTMIAAWDKALRSMTIGERAVIRVKDPSFGYGAVGVPPLIPPNAELEFDVEVLDAQPAMANIDFDSLATADNTPVSSNSTQRG
jgi:FK506-binding protein 1